MGLFDNGSLPERVVKVSFWEKSKFNTKEGRYEDAPPVELLSFENLQAEFNITKYRGGMIDKADINIYGLNANTRNNITSLAKDNYAYGEKNPNRPRYAISIDAGYKGINVAQIYAGDIYQALQISTAPDIGMRVEGRTGFLTRTIWVKDFIVKGTDFKTLCMQAATALNLTLKYNSDKNKVIDGFVFNGRSYDLVNKIQALDNKVIIKCDSVFFNVMDNLPKGRENAILISQDTGMVGLPKPQQFGINVDTLLNPLLESGNWVEVESREIPQFNAFYNISILTHTGSLRGNDFYSKLQCTSHSGLQEN